MSREEMDAVLTSAIPYSWRLSNVHHCLKENVSHWIEATLEE